MDDAQAIQGQIEGLVDAFNRADADTGVAFVTEDVVGMPPNQPAVVGKAALCAYWTAGFRLAKSRLV